MKSCSIDLGVMEKQVSLRKFIAKELFTYNWVCGIFNAHKVVIYLLLGYKAVSISFWLHPVMCCSVLWRELRRANSFLFLRITKISFRMPKNNEIRATGNNSTVHSTPCNAKVAITLIMVFLTVINPLLFVLPAALCGYTLSKDTLSFTDN